MKSRNRLMQSNVFLRALLAMSMATPARQVCAYSGSLSGGTGVMVKDISARSDVVGFWIAKANSSRGLIFIDRHGPHDPMMTS